MFSEGCDFMGAATQHGPTNNLVCRSIRNYNDVKLKVPLQNEETCTYVLVTRGISY